MLDRFHGCLPGLACGDAIGASVEFYQRGRFTPLTDMIGGGKFQLNPGDGQTTQLWRCAWVKACWLVKGSIRKIK